MKNRSHIHASVLSIALAAGALCAPLSACTVGTTGNATNNPAGSGAVHVTAKALDASDVAVVQIQISGNGFAPIEHELVRHGAEWVGIIGEVPAGDNRLITARAFDSGAQIIYQGEADVTIIEDEVTQVMLLLQQVNPPPPFSNEAPRIDALYISAGSVSPGESITLGVTAHDPNPGDSLMFFWQGGDGIFNNPSFDEVVWTAPPFEGPQTLTVRVSDQKGAAATTSIVIDVITDDVGSAAVAADFNTWPELHAIDASDTRLNGGESTVLLADAFDTDGDLLQYQWSADCDGTFSDMSASPMFTLHSLPTSDQCTILVVVRDGRGGVVPGTLGLAVGPEVMPSVAPVVDMTFQSTDVAAPGASVVFRIQGHAESSNVAFDWITSQGGFTVPVTGPNQSEVVWVAPLDFTGTATVTAILTNDRGQKTTRDFVVVAQ